MMEGRILIGGHRGMGATDDEEAEERNKTRGFPLENTPESFKEALNVGVDADFIETDAVAAKDGREIVLIHSNDTNDHIFEKKYNKTGKRYIDQMTPQEVASLRTGSDGSGRIPTLLQLLEVVEKLPGKFINIELKGVQGTDQKEVRGEDWKAPPLVEPLLKIINDKRFPLDRILFSSFSLNTLKELKQLTSNQAKIGVLFSDTKGHLLEGEDYLPFTKRNVDRVLDDFPSLYALMPEISEFIAHPLIPDIVKRKLKIFTYTYPELSSPSEKEYKEKARKALLLCAACDLELGLITDYVKEMKACTKRVPIKR
jgi:glycerophosphoryl diester phosphodiesterase